MSPWEQRLRSGNASGRLAVLGLQWGRLGCVGVAGFGLGALAEPGSLLGLPIR